MRRRHSHLVPPRCLSPSALAVALLIWAFSGGAAATTYVVAPDGSGDFPTIQAAVDAAVDYDIIELTDGVFTGSENRDIDFGGKLLTVRSQSGDSSACVIDCEYLGRGFDFESFEGTGSVVEGLTITRGRVLGYLSYGGAIRCEYYASPTIRNCLFVDNHADFAGGAVSAHTHCDPTIEHCVFIGNSAIGNGFGQGGAIYLGDYADARVVSCTFVENATLIRGGGIDVHLYSTPVIQNCTFYANSGPDGANIGCRHHGWPQIENTIIVFGVGGPGVFTEMDSDPYLTCCDIYGNAGGDWVGQIAPQYGIWGNISEDPLFCDPVGGNLALNDESPCAPFTPPNEQCDLIGAWPPACQSHLIEPDGSGDFPTIQAALDAADEGDVILLAPGVFTGEGNREIDFLGKGVIVRGQFAPADQVIIDCQGAGRGFLFRSGEGSTSRLTAVTVTGGAADFGAGVFCNHASPTITDCIFLDGAATGGGGGAYVAGAGAAPIFSGGTFAGNSSEYSGGGLLVLDHAQVTLEGCTFAQNSAADGGGGIYTGQWSQVDADHCILAFGTAGEAIACDESAAASLTCCDVYGNAGGDWVGCISEQLGVEGNICADPLFCGPGDYTLDHHSPCLPGTPPNEECALIGAHSEGCQESWTVRVLPDGSGDFPTIQDAIDASLSGDTVELGDGTFVGAGNRDIDFRGKAILVRSQSGDPAACVIDCEMSGRGFLFQSGEDPFSVLEGVTVTRGNATGHGGGIVCLQGSRPQIRDCVLRDNFTDGDGGGLYGDAAGPPSIVGCLFEENTAGSMGGGLYIEDAATALTDCEFTANIAGIAGGGACIGGGADAEISDCTFSVNSSGSYGAGLAFWEGDGDLSGCLFQTNGGTAFGGAIWCRGDDPVVSGCTFDGNQALIRGGAIECTNQADMRLTGCTFFANRAALGGGLSSVVGSHPVLTQTIIAFADDGGAAYCDETGLPTFFCCDLYGNNGGDWTGAIADQLGDEGNICEDPLFCDAPGGDFSISAASPCGPHSAPNPECELIGAWPYGCAAHLVHADGSGDFPTIQAAIDGADEGDVILLSPGIYSGEGNRDVDFRGKQVTVMGQVTSPREVLIDCEGLGRGFLFASGEDQGSALRWVTIGGGVADSGAAIFCSGASPQLAYCYCTGCVATVAGGGVYASQSEIQFAYCTLVGNSAGDAGGGLYCEGSTPRLAHCTVADNDAPEGSGLALRAESAATIGNTIVVFGVGGAGIVCDASGSAALSCCDVYGNAGGDWVGCLEGQLDTEGNIALDPAFCGPQNYMLDHHSPCLGHSPPNPECSQIGAWGQGCQEPWALLVLPDGSGDFPTIQGAVDAAMPGDVVELGDGTFRGLGNRDVDFLGKAITVRSQSGDSSRCIIDCEQAGRGFCFDDGEDSLSVLAGVTVTGGRLIGYLSYGAGIRIEDHSSPTIRSCVLTGNHVDFAGGGISIHTYCDPVIQYCVFHDNLASSESYGQGGGVYCGDYCDPRIECCTFTDNEVQFIGGGINVHLYSRPTIRNCTFSGNSGPDGANIGCRHHGWPQLYNSIIAFGENGSGVFCMMDSEPFLACCDVYGNEGGDWIDCIAEFLGVDGNIWADPLFCDELNPREPLRLREGSPCAPFTPPNPECDLIGAWPVGCETQDLPAPCLPTALYLRRCQPNPFAHVARLAYGVPAASASAHVQLRIFDLTGRLVRTLVDAPQAPGHYVAAWDAVGEHGRRVPNGVYYSQLRCAGERLMQRMILVR